MKIRFYKTGELNGSSYFKFPARSNAILNIENNDKYCLLWSILASFHACENDHPNNVSIYRQYFNELNSQGFDISNRFKCRNVHKIEKLNSLSISMFEINFYQDQNNWKHN